MAFRVVFRRIKILSAGILTSLVLATGPVFGALPFADAVAVWQMTDSHDSAGKDSSFEVIGDVLLGGELNEDERDQSRQRSGDGKVAELRGGWLAAAHGAAGELNLTGTALTL